MTRSPWIVVAFSLVTAVALEGDARACQPSHDWADLVIESVTVDGKAVSPAETRSRATLFAGYDRTVDLSIKGDENEREGFRAE